MPVDTSYREQVLEMQIENLMAELKQAKELIAALLEIGMVCDLTPGEEQTRQAAETFVRQ